MSFQQTSNSHFDQACFAVVAGADGLAWVVASCAVLAWCVVSRLTCVVASHAVLTWRAGEGGGLILPALAKSAPTLPSPPRHPGTARCAACVVGDRKSGYLPPRLQCLLLCPRIPVQAHTGSHGQGVSRSDNLCSQCAEDGSPLERAQSEVTSARISRVRQRHPRRTFNTQMAVTSQSLRCAWRRPFRVRVAAIRWLPCLAGASGGAGG